MLHACSLLFKQNIRKNVFSELTHSSSLSRHLAFMHQVIFWLFFNDRSDGKACMQQHKERCDNGDKTDKNEYFFMLAPEKLTTYAFHTCRAWPTNPGPTTATMTCTVPSKLNNGITGAMLKPSKTINIGEHDYVLFSVGPFAFEPACTR